MAFLTALGAEVIFLESHLGAVLDGMGLTTDKAGHLPGFLLLGGSGSRSSGSFDGSRHFFFLSLIYLFLCVCVCVCVLIN